MKAITGDFLHLFVRVAQIIFYLARVSDLLQALQIYVQIVWRLQFLDTLVGLIQTVSVTDQPVFIQRFATWPDRWSRRAELGRASASVYLTGGSASAFP